MRTKKKDFSKKKCEMEYKKITPQTILKLFGKHIAMVNVLSNNIFINKNPIDTSCCHGMNFINKSCQNLKKYKLIILYCANYTCSASHNYAKKLLDKCPQLSNKIVLYEGGINEWALLSFTYPDTFTFFNKETKSQLTKDQVLEQFLTMKHRDESIKKVPYQDIILRNQQDKNFYKDLEINISSKSNSKIMKDKVCVVTGGTSGLGLETVKKLLDNGAKHVTLTYFNNKKRANDVKKMLEKKYDKKRFYVLRADARTVGGNKLTFDRSLRRNRLKLNVGPIDCVDINAGIFGPANLNFKHIHNISEKDYKKTLDLNLTGYFLSLKYFAIQAIKNKVKNASAVCIKSIYGSTGSLFSNTAYQTSKHGVMGLVRQSAIELARPSKELKIKYPIRVNAVSPTFTDTALTRPFLDKSKINKTLKNSNTMGRLAYKRDVAEATLFLLSDKSSSITGIDLPVDCGVLAESIPTYREVKDLNNSGIEELSCCGDAL